MGFVFYNENTFERETMHFIMYLPNLVVII